MIRPGTLVWIGAILAVAMTLFLITYEVQSVEKNITELNQEAVAQEEAIHVLRAEWSYLNRPERLATLAARHLTLQAVEPTQLKAAKQLETPRKPALTQAGDERLQDLLKRVVGNTEP